MCVSVCVSAVGSVSFSTLRLFLASAPRHTHDKSNEVRSLTHVTHVTKTYGPVLAAAVSYSGEKASLHSCDLASTDCSPFAPSAQFLG